MIFDNTKDIQDDIYKKISHFLKDNIENKDIQYVISLVRSYLTELKNIKEIDNYQAEIDKTNDNSIIIQITKDNDNCFFTINLDIEVRRLKINKIKSTDNSVKIFLQTFS